jgi:hypothetical protein
MDAEMMSDDDLLVHVHRAAMILHENRDEDCAEVVHELTIRYNIVCKKFRELLKESKNALR